MRIVVAVFAVLAACGGEKNEPDPAASNSVAAPATVDVRLTSDGALSIEGAKAAHVRDVRAAVVERVEQQGQAACAIRADDPVLYVEVVRALDECKKGGTADISVNDVSLDIPQTKSGAVLEHSNVILTIGLQNELYLAGRPIGDEDLAAGLKALMKQPDTGVFILADNAAPIGRVVSVWKRALAVGVPSIRLVHRSDALRHGLPERPR